MNTFTKTFLLVVLLVADAFAAEAGSEIAERVNGTRFVEEKLRVLEAEFKDTAEWGDLLEDIVDRESSPLAKLQLIHFYWKHRSRKSTAFIGHALDFARKHNVEFQITTVGEMIRDQRAWIEVYPIISASRTPTDEQRVAIRLVNNGDAPFYYFSRGEDLLEGLDVRREAQRRGTWSSLRNQEEARAIIELAPKEARTFLAFIPAATFPAGAVRFHKNVYGSKDTSKPPIYYLYSRELKSKDFSNE